MFPTTLQRILVPIDFSDLSDQAFEAAVTLAHTSGARLMLMHAFETPYLAGEAGFSEADLVSSMERHADQHLALRAAKAERQRVRCEIFTRVGKPHVEILKVIEQKEPDLVVMSTHGWTGLKHAVLGSVTERVVQRSRCPVLVLPTQPA